MDATSFARIIEAQPVVTNSTVRDALFPNPAIGQRVANDATGYYERWDGAQWIQEAFRLTGGPVISVRAKGAKGDGVAPDSKAVRDAIAAAAASAQVGTVLFPPGVYIADSSWGAIPANVQIRGHGEKSTRVIKQFNGDLITDLGSNVLLEDIWLDGNGALFTGRGVVVAQVSFEQKINRCKIADFVGYCVEYAVPGAGGSSVITESVLYRHDLTLSAIGCPDEAFAGFSGLTRYFDGIRPGGGAIVDFNGIGDGWLIRSFPRNVTFGRNASIVSLYGNRFASLGQPIYIDGFEHCITSNVMAGPVIFKQSGNVNGTIYRANSEDSVYAGIGKFNQIDHVTRPWRQGSYATTGSMALNSYELTGAAVGNVFIGQYVTVAGAGAGGATLKSMVVGTHASSVFLLHPCLTAVAGAAVNFSLNIITDGTVSTTANITSGSAVVVVASAAGLVEGALVSIGAAAGDTSQIDTMILNISGTNVTLAHPMERTAAGVSVLAQGAALALGTGGKCEMFMRREGDRCYASFNLTFGSAGATFGGGATAWRIWLPYPAAPLGSQFFTVVGQDASATTDYTFRASIAAQEQSFTLGQNAQGVRSSFPFTWAVNDFIQGAFHYGVY